MASNQRVSPEGDTLLTVSGPEKRPSDQIRLIPGDRVVFTNNRSDRFPGVIKLTGMYYDDLRLETEVVSGGKLMIKNVGTAPVLVPNHSSLARLKPLSHLETLHFTYDTGFIFTTYLPCVSVTTNNYTLFKLRFKMTGQLEVSANLIEKI
jgi:hypothetical protein